MLARNGQDQRVRARWLPINISDPTWYVEMRATHHISSSLDNTQKAVDYKGNGRLTMGNGQHMKITKSKKLVRIII